MGEVTAYYVTDAEESAREYITDYSASMLAALAAAEERGAIIRAVRDDGTEEQVAASEVSNPNEALTASATLGVSYNATAAGGGMRLMKAALAREPWSGSLTIGGTTLEYEDGLLVAVSQTEGGSGAVTK